MKLLLLLLPLAIFGIADGAKILALFHFPSKSHHILGDALLKGLARKGHDVTMLSPYPAKRQELPNYTDIELEGLQKYKEEKMDTRFTSGNSTFLDMIFSMTKIMGTINEMTLSNRPLQEILKKNTTYDVIIIECFTNEAFLGLGPKLKAQTVVFSPIGSTFVTDKMTGNTSPYSYIPHMILPFTSEMNFWQRAATTAVSVFFNVFVYFMSDQEELLKKYFPDSPPLDDLIKDVALVFVNTHYSTESPRPYVPNVIPIGGFHLQEAKPLIGSLKAVLDLAEDGVVFMSFGTNVKLSSLPKDKLDAFARVFKELNMVVLWKSDVEIENLPSNVRVEKWMPQNDILAHPNVKLFISHGGFGSTTEAIYNGVPIIGIPFFGDQSKNVADCVRKGFAIQINFNDVTEESLRAAIDEILGNPIYRNNVKRVSSLLRDQPLKPMDNAIFWIEHIIRHKGGAHLKNSGIKLAWYQYFLLDVIAFIIFAIIALLIVAYLTTRAFFRCVKRRFGRKIKHD